ncbi:MAG: PIN domain-containing protein [Desulfurococcales archaeon]|nr:PIN domain-containing protein [Desulfurococcales archaeon]
MRPQKITIDTNKILAAVLKPGKVRERLFNIPTIIITPKHAWREVSKHIERLAARKGVEKDKLKEILEEIKREIIVELDPKQPYTVMAKGIASRFDPDDWPFIALALQHNNMDKRLGANKRFAEDRKIQGNRHTSTRNATRRKTLE